MICILERARAAGLSLDHPWFSPKAFAVERSWREDYRIVGEHRQEGFVKSFLAGKRGLCLFRSDEWTNTFLKIDILSGCNRDGHQFD